MTAHARLLLVSSLTVALGTWFLATGSGTAADGAVGWKPMIPEEDVTKLIQHDAKTIYDKLPAGDPKAVKRVRMAALMIAAYAESSKNGARGNLMGVRDSALKLAEDAKNKKLDGAKKDVASIMELKGTGAKPAGGFPKELDLEDVMRPFGLPSTGGEGIEKELLSLNRRPLSPADMAKRSEHLALIGYKASVIGELAKLNPSEAAQKNATKRKKWDGWADDMAKAAVEFAEAAKAKKPDLLKKAAIKLNNSCSACHAEFRAEE
jgi:hypothetical protein